ncbi:MAG: tyrosine-type recombinase/integrase [Phycisphaeraceae bacterium]
MSSPQPESSNGQQPAPESEPAGGELLHEPLAGGAVRRYLAALAPNSQRTLRQSLGIVASYLSRQEGTLAEGYAWHTLTPAQLQQVRQYLRENPGYAVATANKILAAVRGVLRAAHDLQLISATNLRMTLAPLRIIQEEPGDADDRLPTPSQVNRLFAVCQADPTPAGARDAALLATVLSSGLRRSEAADLDLADYDASWGRLRIRSPVTDDSRLVVFSAAARATMNHWLADRGDRAGPLLQPVNKSGAIIWRRLTDQAIYDIIRRLAQRAGLPHLTMRDLRRAYVVSLIAAGHTQEQVQQLAGHASWLTTAAYQRMTQRLKQETDRTLKLPYRPALPKDAGKKTKPHSTTQSGDSHGSQPDD